MDGNGAVNVCSCFCLNAQLNGNQNVMVVGTSYRITWLFPYSQPGEGRKKWSEGKYKRISSILKSLHNQTLSSFVAVSISLSFGAWCFTSYCNPSSSEHLKLYCWVLNVPELIGEYWEWGKYGILCVLVPYNNFLKRTKKKVQSKSDSKCF